MGQIGTPLKVVEIPRPEIAPDFTPAPPERAPEQEPIPMEPITVPVKTPAPERKKAVPV